MKKGLTFDDSEVVEMPLEIWEKKNKPKRGILLFATGHPYYGECAVRLAASLKYHSPEIGITVVSDAPAQNRTIDNAPKLFDSIITPKQYQILQNGKRVDIRAKMYAYEISPYEETLMLDVDLIWLIKKKPSEFFDSMAGHNFFIQNTGFADLSKEDVDNQVSFFWTKISDAKKAYGFTEGKFYQYTGEFVYFRKCKEVENWYNVALDVYDNCKIEDIIAFANQKCNDEIAYSIASVITGLYPHKSAYLPVFWPWRNKKFENMMGKSYVDLSKEFYAMSVGGNQQPEMYKKQYELVAQGYLSKLGIRGIPSKLADKKRVIVERRKI